MSIFRNRAVSWLNSFSEIHFLLLLLGSTLVYTILIGLQGFDMMDEGWVATAYQQLFEHPQSAEYQFLYYNSVLAGAIWNSMFGRLGLLGFRILSAICMTMITYIVYELLHRDIDRWAIFLGILIILFSKHYILVFHHNYFTALFCFSAVLFLFKAVKTKRSPFIFLAGLLIGVNIFARIPNISMLSLSLVLIPFAIYTQDIKATLRLFLWGILGVMAGIAINVFLIKSLGHWELFINNLSSGFSVVSTEGSSHNLSNILHVYLHDYYILIKQIVFLFTLPIICFFIKRWLPSKYFQKAILGIIFLLYFLIIWHKSYASYSLYAFSYVVLVIYAFTHYRQENEIYMISCAVIVFFFLPFGSDGGISNGGLECTWLGFPLAIGLLFKMVQEYWDNSVTRKTIISTFCVFVLAFSLSNLYQTSQGCYFDSGSRFTKVYQINHPLATTYTDKHKCELVNELLSHLNCYVHEGDYLLCWQHVPMVHYLTHTYPYLNTSLPWVYTPDVLEKKFSCAENSIEQLPVILCNKSAIANWFWFNPDWNSENADDQWNFNTQKAKAFHSFIRDNGYITAWENELFKIMIPDFN